MGAQTSVNNSQSSKEKGKRNINRPSAGQEKCYLLRLSPLILVFVGCILTVVGNIASQRSCEIAGPVFMSMGGLLMLFITFWTSRQARLSVEMHASCEERVNRRNEPNIEFGLSEEGSNFQLGPIHQVDVWISSETLGPKLVPPSYEEAVSEANVENCGVAS